MVSRKKKPLPVWAFSHNPYRHKKILFDSTDPSLADRIRAGGFSEQPQCPLFKVPPEIRNAIFRFAMTEYPIANDKKHWRNPTRRRAQGTVQGPQGWVRLARSATPYSWPCEIGLKRVFVELLRSCKRVYLETHHLPPLVKEHVFWHTDIRPTHMNARTEIKYFRRFTPNQLDNVDAVHLYVSQTWLEENLPQTLALPYLQGIRKLTMTIGGRDWNPRTTTIDAMRGFGNLKYHGRNTRLVDEGILLWNDLGWGWDLKKLPALRELKMVFDCNNLCNRDLEGSLIPALAWEFPCHDERYILSTKHCPKALRKVGNSRGMGLIFSGPPFGSCRILLEISWKIRLRDEEYDLEGMKDSGRKRG